MLLLLGRAGDLDGEGVTPAAALDGERDEVEAGGRGARRRRLGRIRRRGSARQPASKAAASRTAIRSGSGQAGSTSTASGPLRPLAMRARSG